MVFENSAMRGIFGPKRKQVAVCYIKLHNEKFITCTLHEISLG
jgi:hypothetical protein